MYDVAIIGLGAMGSASAYQLARAGVKVIGFDRFSPPHRLGSSHGSTRVIRGAYFEDPAYVPLLQRAYTLWQELQQQWPQTLIQLTGGLMIGPPQGELVQGCLQAARRFELEHQLLDQAQICLRQPAFRLPESFAAVAEARTGYLYAERCIEAQLSLAKAAGAELRTNCQIQGWRKMSQGYEIQAGSEVIRARKLVLCAGAWLGRLLPELGLPLEVTRQTLFWFEATQPEHFQLGRFEVFLIEIEPGKYLYGFPDAGEGFKVALHARGSLLDPEKLAEQRVQPEDLSQMRALLERWLPAANGSLLQSAVCMYTNLPDGHFLVDQHPQDPDLLLVSPCSGHGFKFSALIGEKVRRWLQTGSLDADLKLFGYRRLQRS